MSENRFHWVITTLTPLHVGSGERLREGFDFIEYEGRLWIANQGALFRAVLEQARHVRTDDEAIIATDIAGMTIYQMMDNGWLRPEHFDSNKRIFHYSLEGNTSKKGRDGELFAHIKDIKKQPYLPGSSIKGALRSTIMRGLAGNDSRKPEYQPGNPKNAAAKMERRYFAAPKGDWKKFPNFDIWRAFRIEDASITDFDSDKHLKLAYAIVHKQPPKNPKGKYSEGESIPLDLEVIPEGVTLELNGKVDTWLFEDPSARKELGFTEKQTDWMMDGLILSVNLETGSRLEEERDYFKLMKERGGKLPGGVARSIKDLFDAFNALQPNEMILPVGKGTGWRSKTLGRVLQDRLTDEEFSGMVRKFRLGKGMWKKNESIPYTRVLSTEGGQHNTPLGWVKIRMEAG